MGASTWHGLIGTPGYASGTAGTVTVPNGATLLKVWCRSSAGGTVAIFGGANIPVIANATAFDLDLKHCLFGARGTGADAQIVFTGTDAYFVHWVRQGNVAP